MAETFTTWAKLKEEVIKHQKAHGESTDKDTVMSLCHCIMKLRDHAYEVAT